MAYNNNFCKTGKSKSSPITKKVPNCVPKGKQKKESGDPCWKNYVQRGMKTK